MKMNNLDKLAAFEKIYHRFAGKLFTGAEYEGFLAEHHFSGLPGLGSLDEWGWLHIARKDEFRVYECGEDGCVLVSFGQGAVSSGLSPKTFDALPEVIRRGCNAHYDAGYHLIYELNEEVMIDWLVALRDEAITILDRIEEIEESEED